MQFDPEARERIKAAFDGFNAVVAPTHQRQFASTKLKDVWIAAKEVESKLALKHSSRNLRRIKPFLDGLEHYSKVMEVLCNGTPYLPWIWAPVKLCILVASDFVDAFDKLIGAYHEIAEFLPRFDRLGSSLKENSDFQQVLALVYCDIIEFHTRAYKFFTDSAWIRFFNTQWKRFDTRFATILESLKHHAELVDKEASSIGVAIAHQSLCLLNETRDKLYAMADRKEKEQLEYQLQSVLSWVQSADSAHEDDFHRLQAKAIIGTYNWFLEHRLVREWISIDSNKSILWIHGNPGSGKSVLCVQLISHLRSLEPSTTIYHLCSFRSVARNSCSAFLKSIVAQLVTQQPHLATHVYHEYICKGLNPSISNVQSLLNDLPTGSLPLRILLDGLDECSVEERKAISMMCDNITKSGNHKIAIFSQNIPDLQRSLRKQPTLSMSKEAIAIEHAIGICVKHGLQSIEHGHDSSEAKNAIFTRLQRHIVAKAEGMFLWVQLVLASLEDAHSLQELEDAVEHLPRGLENAYAHIIEKMQSRLSTKHFAETRKIFSWIAFAERPLREHEILSGLVLAGDTGIINERTRLNKQALDAARPLIDLDGKSITFVHFTVKKFLLSITSGPLLVAIEAQADLALACIRSTISSLDFVDESLGKNEIINNLLGGVYGLQSYASDYWVSHLKCYDECKAASSKASQRASVETSVANIAARHGYLLDRLGGAILLDPKNPPENKFKTMNFAAEILAMFDALEFDKAQIDASQATASSDAPRENSVVERTIFSKANRNYEQHVQALVVGENELDFSHLEADRIHRFREQFADLVYLCHSPGCPRRTRGFPNDRSRLEHEQTHRPRLYCPNATCMYASLTGFSSAQALKRHVVKCHTSSPHRIPAFRLTESSGAPSGTKDPLSPGPSRRSAEPVLIDSNDGNAISGLWYIADEIDRIGNKLCEYHLDRLPDDRKCEGDDWHTISNPKVNHWLEIDLTHSLNHESVVTSVCFNWDGTYIATCCDRSTNIYDAANGRLLHCLKNPRNNTDGDLYDRSACFSPDGRMLVVGSEDKTVRVWDINSKSIIHELSGHDQGVYSVDCSLDGEIIASGSEDRMIRLWNSASGECFKVISCPDGITCISISSRFQVIAASTLDSFVSVWNLHTGDLIMTTRDTAAGHRDSVYSVSFSPLHDLLISGSLDGTLRTWIPRLHPPNSESLICHQVFEGHSDFVLSAAFTGDGKWILSSSKDRGVQFWNPGTGVAHTRLDGHKNAVIKVATSPAENLFATAGGDKKARIWRYKEVSGVSYPSDRNPEPPWPFYNPSSLTVPESLQSHDDEQ